MPNPKLWSDTPVTGPSAGMVQQHFLKIRLRELAMRGPEYEQKILKKLVGKLDNTHRRGVMDRLRGKKENSWTIAYDIINKRLQQSDLTINFSADSWFGDENKLTSYAQMYERATTGTRGAGYVLHTAGSNSAKTRANVDDGITFPANWKSNIKDPSHRIMQPVGLAPGRGATRQRIRNQMAFDGKDAAVQRPGFSGSNASQVPAPFFNPKTKQVFAALNYGRRPRGAISFYGTSHFVLADRLKVNAIYYPKDTFMYTGVEAQGISDQFPYSHLAAAVAFSDFLGDQIIQSCLHNITLPDTDSPLELLEGHIHSALPFAGNLKKIVLCVADQTDEVAINAKKFADRWSTELVFINPPSHIS